MKKLLFGLFIRLIIGCKSEKKKQLQTELLINEIIDEMGDNPVEDKCYGDCESGIGGEVR